MKICEYFTIFQSNKVDKLKYYGRKSSAHAVRVNNFAIFVVANALKHRNVTLWVNPNLNLPK